MSVPPLLYHQVRMLAEAALGVPNGTSSTFWFNPGNTNGPVQLQSGSSLPADGVLASATNFTTVGPLTAVWLRAGAQDGGVNVLNLGPGVQADAAFWTDGSVQKFVLPYYASCMGYEASARLTRLQQIWNGDLPDGRRVYALLHVTGTPPLAPGAQPQSLEPIWAVYLDAAGQSHAASLADFAGPLPELPPLAPPPAQPYTQPQAAVLQGPAPTYGALRSLAEWSTSFHESATYFVYEPARNSFRQTPTPPTDGSAVVLPVCNPRIPADRPTDIQVTVEAGGASGTVFDWMSYQKDDPDNKPDAFLWSTGSIEQFMLPYYASIDGFAGLPDLLFLQDAWMMNQPGTGGYSLAAAGDSGLLGPEENQVLGLVHIPRSIWVTEEESVAVGETSVLHTAGPRHVLKTEVRKFIAKSRRAR